MPVFVRLCYRKIAGMLSFNMDSNAIHSEGLAARLEAIFPRWRGRPDSEHEQAVIRLIVGGIAALYLFWVLLSPEKSNVKFEALLTITLFFIFAVSIVAWLFVNPKISKPRRLLGIFADMAGTTMALYFTGKMATPVFVIYLWVTFGNGFRFGKPYLYISMAMSILGYSLVIYTSPYWYVSPQVTYGLLIGLFVLPLYVSALLGRLTSAMDRLERANEAKSNFLAVMSHEIRTPLSGILGLINLIKHTRLNPKQSHYVQLIERSSDWLYRVISDGLDFSKIEADELIISTEAFSPAQILADLDSFYQEIALDKGIRFSSTIDPDLPKCVSGDKEKLTQVLNNLLTNAFKFTEGGEVNLGVRLRHTDENRAKISFTISDTGVGISSEEQQHIFKPFRQADSSTTRKFGGTGLGLAIADRIVRLMGGAIAVESAKGKGTTFQFILSLPLAVFLDSTVAEEGRADLPPMWEKTPRVLLVEDHEINREVLQQLLSVAGCDVTVAHNGRQAIDSVWDHDWDLIFMDCQMPVVDGYEATRQIRLQQQASLKAALPIIALTAHVTVADRNKCLGAGMSDYLGKPCTLSDLILTLKKWLPELLLEGKQTPRHTLNEENSVEPETIETERAGALRRQEIHDLRNFYTKIIGSAELAQLKCDSPDEVRKYMDMILKATRKEIKRLR